jgi:hypothetical protein
MTDILEFSRPLRTQRRLLKSRGDNRVTLPESLCYATFCEFQTQFKEQITMSSNCSNNMERVRTPIGTYVLRFSVYLFPLQVAA